MSLHILVGRFGTFLSEQTEPEQTETVRELFPNDLARIHGAFGHHLVPLMLLARADGDAAIVERQVIFEHCIELAEKNQLELTAAEKAALNEYLCDFRPSRIQLFSALKRLEHGTKDEVTALISAAQAVVDADGVRRPEEVHLLASLERDLANL